MTTRSTSACVASAFRSGDSAAKRATAALERITISGEPESDADTASASANERKSISGSGRSRRNGSTASRVSGRARAAAAVPLPTRTASSSPDISAAEAGRSAGRLASARRSTRSKAAIAASPVSAGGCS
jgi:hypothetical protein